MPREKHGAANKNSQFYREYQIFKAIIRRCENPKVFEYSYYGARGIKICPQWRHSFLTFLKDVGPRPGPEYSLDRIDVDGNYEPGNCKWILKSEQAANRRCVKKAIVDGKPMPAYQLARVNGVKKSTFSERLSRGWDPQTAATTKVKEEEK